jgi:translation initiation factor IF-1
MPGATHEEGLVRVPGRDAGDLEWLARHEALGVEPRGQLRGIAEHRRERLDVRHAARFSAEPWRVATTRALLARAPCDRHARFEGARLARDDLIQIKGTITEALAGGNYRVKGDNGMEFLAKIGGRMRRYHIRVIPGDRVTIAVSPYDPTHGLIVFRGG